MSAAVSTIGQVTQMMIRYKVILPGLGPNDYEPADLAVVC